MNLLQIIFFDGLMQRINDGHKTIKGWRKNPRGFIGNTSSFAAAGHGATIFQIPPDIAGLPSAVAWPYLWVEGASSTMESGQCVVRWSDVAQATVNREKFDG